MKNEFTRLREQLKQHSKLMAESVNEIVSYLKSSRFSNALRELVKQASSYAKLRTETLTSAESSQHGCVCGSSCKCSKKDSASNTDKLQAPTAEQSAKSSASAADSQQSCESKTMSRKRKKLSTHSADGENTLQTDEERDFQAYKSRVRNLHKSLSDSEILQEYEAHKLKKQKKLEKAQKEA